MNDIELKPGEEICPKCNGTGKKPDTIINASGYEILPFCEKCWGDGKLDWIQMAMGKDLDPYRSIVLPMLRKVYPRLIAQDIVGCQPIKGNTSE